MRAKQFRQGFFVGLLLLVALGLASLIFGLVGKVHIAVTEAYRAKQQYQILEDRKSALEAKLAELTTLRGQDAAIRTAFGVARPGEEVIVVVPPKPETPTTTPPWWKSVFDWFK